MGTPALTPEGFLSKGTELHALGTCRPCFFCSKKEGPRAHCRNGVDCNYCHMPHDISEPLRPCKNKRARAKRLAKQLAKGCTDAQELEEAANMLESSSRCYLKAVL